MNTRWCRSLCNGKHQKINYYNYMSTHIIDVPIYFRTFPCVIPSDYWRDTFIQIQCHILVATKCRNWSIPRSTIFFYGGGGSRRGQRSFRVYIRIYNNYKKILKLITIFTMHSHKMVNTFFFFLTFYNFIICTNIVQNFWTSVCTGTTSNRTSKSFLNLKQNSSCCYLVVCRTEPD